MDAVVAALRQSVEWSSEDVLRGAFRDASPAEFQDPTTRVSGTLSRFCRVLKRPLVVFFDEADCLSEQTLVTFLRQLRSGYISRDDAPFPWSVALVGMRNIRDYKASVRAENKSLRDASPFNIITEALTLRNFTADEIGQLYRQHTDATGQVFEPEAAARAYYWTEGQPWLVNAIARQVIEKDLARDFTVPVTAAHIDAAAETLMKRRDTHIDSLLERRREPRVRAVIEPMLAGGAADVDLLADDTRFCLDLGLVTLDPKRGLRPANPVYRDVMVRMLNYTTQTADLPASLENRWMDGKNLDMTGLLKEFQDFWRRNADILVNRYEYKEAAPHLILQAFLQRVVNGGARIEREYALGRGRVDVAVAYAGRVYPVELKRADCRRSGDEIREQMLGYMDLCGSREGWLVTFDRDPDKPWDEKIGWATETLPDGRVIHRVGC
jgi:hypothetical protein